MKRGTTVSSGKLSRRKKLLNYTHVLTTLCCSEAYCHGEMTGLGQGIAPLIGDTPIRETQDIVIV